jgi:hypothetical protein
MRIAGVSTTASRSQRTVESLANALGKHAREREIYLTRVNAN